METNVDTILLVEDDPNDVTLIKRAFRKINLGCSLQVVNDGQQAIDYLEGVSPYDDRTLHPLPSLVLLDLKLPKKSGFEILEWLRGQSKLCRIPVVFLTSSDETSDIDRAYKLGANSYLVKPVAFGTLVVAGDVTLEEVRQEATAAFGDWENPDVLEAPAEDSAQIASPASGPTTIYLVDKPGAAQSVIQAGHATVPRNHPDYFRLVLLNFVFGGQFSARLNQNLRQDKGYSYGFHSSINWFHQPSALVAGGSVQTGVTKESVVEILQEFRDIHGQRPITSEELGSAQAGMLQGLPAGFERPGQIMGSLVQMVVHNLPNDYFRTVGQNLSAVNLDEAKVAGQARIDPDNLVILVVGDRAAIEGGLRELDLPLVILNDDGETAG
ncbi:MAG: insulinase family protein [Chloroflexi bacterium]|nr:insulinase family protein [Chloroflexota bacterium]